MNNSIRFGRLLRRALGAASQRRRIFVFLFPLVFFVFVSAAWFFPVVQNFSTSMAGIGGDPYQTLWRFNRLGESVSNGSIFVPEENTLPNLAPLPWLPIYYIFGDVAAHNTAWLVSAVLAGYLGFILARQWGAKFWPALIAGLLTEFAPYRVAQSLGHFGAMQIWVILAVLICLTAWGKTKNILYFLLGMAFTVLTAWTDHQLFVVLMMILAVFGFAYFIRVKLLQGLILAGLFALTFFVAIGPFMGAIGIVSENTSHFNLGSAQRENFSAGWRSVFLPAPFSLIGSRSFSGDPAADKIHTLGVVLPVTAVALFLITKKSKKDVVLAVLIVTGLVLSMGDSITLFEKQIYLPGKFLFQLPVLSAIRTTGRFIVLPVIFLPLLFALKWDAKKNIILIIVALACVAEVIPVLGFPSMKIDHAKALEISEKLVDGSILAIPAYTNYRYGSEQLYYSLDYKRPVVGNSALSRIIDPASLEEFLATPVIRDLVLLRLADFDPQTIFGQRNKDIVNMAFETQGIGQILLETNPEGGVISVEGNRYKKLGGTDIEKIRKYLRETLELPETAMGEGMFVYHLPGTVSGDSYFAMEGKGWMIKKKSAEQSVIELQKTADFYVYSESGSSADFGMTIIDSAGNANLRLQSGDRENNISIRQGERVNLRLETEKGKLTKFTIILDGMPILVENPRIQVKP